MTLEQVADMLAATGYPVAFQEWKQGAVPPLPYIIYLSPYTNNFAADGAAYYVVNHVKIELYSKLKDPVAEGKVEQALSSFFWQKETYYLDTEKCFQTLYEIEV